MFIGCSVAPVAEPRPASLEVGGTVGVAVQSVAQRLPVLEAGQQRKPVERLAARLLLAPQAVGQPLQGQCLHRALDYLSLNGLAELGQFTLQIFHNILTLQLPAETGTYGRHGAMATAATRGRHDRGCSKRARHGFGDAKVMQTNENKNKKAFIFSYIHQTDDTTRPEAHMATLVKISYGRRRAAQRTERQAVAKGPQP